MMLLSCEKVARRCASCGDAAILSRGGGKDMLWELDPPPRVGDDESASGLKAMLRLATNDCRPV